MSELLFNSKINSPINTLNSSTINILSSPKRQHSSTEIEPIQILIKDPFLTEKTRIHLKKTFNLNLSLFPNEEDESNQFLNRENEQQILYKRQNMIRKLYLKRNSSLTRRQTQTNISPLKLFDESKEELVNIYQKRKSNLHNFRRGSLTLLTNELFNKNNENEKHNKKNKSNNDNIIKEEKKKEKKDDTINEEVKNSNNKKENRKSKKSIKENTTCSCVCIIY
jgi:hypothetical protein